MNNSLILILSILSFISQAASQGCPGSAYGCACNCKDFKCGSTGSSSGASCWYNCCWMTMSLDNQKYIFCN